MNTTVSINIAEQSFVLDELAYEKLKQYLDAISSHFGNDEDGKEIVQDIEVRIAELCHDVITVHKNVVTTEDIESIIAEMGSVEDITGSDEDDDTREQHRQSDNQESQWRPGKKLMRDTDDQVIAGVASGMAAFFGIDVTIVRIIWIILFFVSGGSIVLFYVVFWISMPEAKTSSDKLQMRGMPVTVSGIQDSVKQAMDSETVEKSASLATRIFNQIWEFLGQIFTGIGKVFALIIPVVSVVIGLALSLAAVAVLMFVTIIASQFLWLDTGLLYGPFAAVIDTIPVLARNVFIGSAYIAIASVALLILLDGVALVLRRKIIPTAVKVTFIVISIIAASTAASLAVRYAENAANTFEEVQQSYRDSLEEVVIPLDEEFLTLQVEDGITVSVVESATQSVTVKGDDNFLEHLDVHVEDDHLVVRLRKNYIWFWCVNCNQWFSTVTISTPVLLGAEAKEGSMIFTEQWPTSGLYTEAGLSPDVQLALPIDANAPLSLNATAGSRIQASSLLANLLVLNASSGSRMTIDSLAAESLQLEATAGSHVNLAGSSVAANHTATGGSRIFASKLISDTSEVIANSGSRVEVAPQINLEVEATAGSTVLYSGSPIIKQRVSGGATLESKLQIEE